MALGEKKFDIPDLDSEKSTLPSPSLSLTPITVEGNNLIVCTFNHLIKQGIDLSNY